MTKENKKILTIFLLLLGLTVIIFGASYAFFTYQKDGTKTVTMTSGSVKLHYQESSLNNINLTNALPMDDERGKAQTDYFEFTITSETAGYEIPYYVTSRVTTNSEDQIPASYISLYLTEVVNNEEVEVLDTTYDALTNVSKNNHIEQQLMSNTVAENNANYEKTYRLRLWINEDADYTPTEVNGVQTYPMQDKTFDFIVNVYTEVETVAVTCGVQPNDLYCFESECFRVVSADCDGNTVLVAEKNLNIFGDDYNNATGVQFVTDREYYFDVSPIVPFVATKTQVELNNYVYGYEYEDGWVEHTYNLSSNSYYWYNRFGTSDQYPGDFDAATETKYPYVFDASITTEQPVYDYGSYRCENGNCLGYLVSQYETLLKSQTYNVPQNATVRLLSKEEADLMLENNVSIHTGYPFWLGSLARETSDIELAYEPDGLKLVIEDKMWIFDGSSFERVSLYDDDYNSYNMYAVRAAIELPTSSLPQSAKIVVPQTTPYVFPKTQTIATTLGIDYDDINLDYDLIYAHTEPAGKQYETRKGSALPADLHVIEFLSSTPLSVSGSFSGFTTDEGIKLIHKYLESLADDGKIYDKDGEQINSSDMLLTTYDYYGYVTINGTRYYFNTYVQGNYNHYLFGTYASYNRLEMSTARWYN